MKQNKRFKQDFIINKDYITNQNLSKNYDNLNLKPQNKKHKFTKIYGGVSLAVFMGVSTLCGVLISPINHNSILSTTLGNTTANSSANSQTQTGLITPHEDDPVVYTTESGLDIKWGNVSDIEEIKDGNAYVNPFGEISNGNLSSGNLSGFPYFTTNNGSTEYTWVIIGRSTQGFSNEMIYDRLFKKLSEWQGIATNYYMYETFFNSIYETSSPAGSLLSSINMLDSETAHGYCSIYNTILSSASIQATDEIPAGCVLVLCNNITGTGVANTSSRAWGHNGYSYYAGYHSSHTGTMATVMNDYYTNNSLGLTNIYNYIKPIALNTSGQTGITASNKFNSGSYNSTNYIFPLSQTSDFSWSSYLTASQMKLTSNQWLRDGTASGSSYVKSSYSDDTLHSYYAYKYYLDTSATSKSQDVKSSAGYRPAFVLNLLSYDI